MQATEQATYEPRLGIDVFTTGQISRLLCVAPRTVAKWCDSGALAHYRLPYSKDRRILRDTLRRFLDAQGVPNMLQAECQILTVGVSQIVPEAVRVESLFNLGIRLDRLAKRHIIVMDLATTGRREAMYAAITLRSEFKAARMKLIALACEDECAALELGAAGFNTVLLSPVAPKVLQQAIQAAMGEE